MNATSDNSPLENPLSILIIDDDPLFRLGLLTAIAVFPEITIYEATSKKNAHLILANQHPNIIILEIGLADGSGWSLCQQLRQDYPLLPILLLTSETHYSLLKSAQKLGIMGYCPKGITINDLIAAIRQVASGNPYWEHLSTLNPTLAYSSNAPIWLQQMQKLGLSQIEAQINLIQTKLTQETLSLLDRVFWQGRQRELKTAYWLVSKITTPMISNPQSTVPETNQDSPLQQQQTLEKVNYPILPYQGKNQPSIPLSLSIFEDILNKLQFPTAITNLSNIPLTFELLTLDKKQELCYLILEQINRQIQELRFLGLTQERLNQRLSKSIAQIWRDSTLNFFIKNCPDPYLSENYQLLELLWQDYSNIEQEILQKIPLIPVLFAYFLFEEPLSVAGVSYRHEAPEAREQAQLILENLMLRLAHGVMTSILNNFAEFEPIKPNLYPVTLRSSREIARFRNQISWYYRLEQYWYHPKQIFESNYCLLSISTQGITSKTIYAPRQAELLELEGIAYLVTIILELRDAIAPRFRSLISLLGKGLVYILTQVIGKGIGLIIKGVIQGVGNSWQEIRYSRNSQRR